MLAQLGEEYDPETLAHLPVPGPAGHAPLGSQQARRLAEDRRLFLLPPHTPHLSWIIYGFFLHEGLGRSVDTYRLAVDCARRYRPFAVPASVTTPTLRTLWKDQHRSRPLDSAPIQQLSNQVLLSVPALDPWTLRLWLIRNGKLRSESRILTDPGSHGRLLRIDGTLAALGLRPGDQLIWAVVTSDNPERGHSLHGLTVAVPP